MKNAAYSIVGFFDPIGKRIGFVVPIFEYEKSLWIQDGNEEKIFSFKPSVEISDIAIPTYLEPEYSEVTVGDYLIYAFVMPDGNIKCGDKRHLMSELSTRTDALSSFPFLQMEVYAFLNMQRKLRQAIERNSKLLSKLDPEIASFWREFNLELFADSHVNDIEEPIYKPGDEVQCVSDPSRIGVVVEICEVHAGVQWYRVNFGAPGRPKMSEIDLRPFVPTDRPYDNLINGIIDGYAEFQRLITHQRLLRDHPLRNNIYAFNASRTRFFPYQFKPLLKFLDSPKHRLLIADEVGLGKTIEAGFILTELKARQTIQRVLVVCPASLTQKWRLELKKRFGEEFKILASRAFVDFLDEYADSPHDTDLNGIISYESIRNKSILDQMENLSPRFDLVIADEAHWMRNFGRKQRRAGVILSECSDAMILLTATPIHLGNENLFSLLNILDDDDFPDIYTADNRFKANEPIVKSQICMGQIPPLVDETIKQLHMAQTSAYVQGHPLYDEIVSDLYDMKSQEDDSTITRREILKVQRDLSELNLIGHIFTRTKKREVQTNFPTRKAYPIRLKFTDIESRFYNAVTAYVRAECEQRIDSPVLRQWVLNTPQRRMASSIPAMVKYYKENIGLDVHDHSEDIDDVDESFEAMSFINQDVELSRTRLRKVLKEWPKDSTDTKYAEFIKILKGLKEKEGNLRSIVFAFFKDSLKYLKGRLEEDGFKCALISGDIKPEDRVRIVDEFSTNPNFEILLSSKVGGEGLDFQFCDTIFNYDLPWNPMEVEQRIGRIDRIGQESNVIRIYNFWIEETIEQRILERLYTRIGIFERSVGELEMILGDELSTLERDILSKKLTKQEEEQLIEQKARAVETRLQELEKLEKNSAQFIGTDQFFENEVQMIKERRRYITGEQMHRFIVDFMKNNCPRSRLEYFHKEKYGKLYPDQELRNHLMKQGAPGELIRYLSSTQEGVPITFDAQAAFDNPKIDFINVLHPITLAITNHYSESDQLNSNAHYVVLKTEKINQGHYVYFIYKLRVNAARGGNFLEMVLLDSELNEACTSDHAEVILGEMVENGTDSEESDWVLDPNIAKKACQEAETIFLNRTNSIREQTKKNNDAFVDRRLESLIESYGKNIEQKKSQLEKALSEKKDERYIRLLKGTLRRLETELEQKRNELNNLRILQVEYDEISAGILEVI